ncbi:WXG100 family type VII secretion target [Actinomadura rupiterrae]|uniref:WXG100 family type VII secretion target n=1 Tax=Actinomadura rupiterrae TaxID=559627 RepID=UPI0020A583AE|nr:hypothetical protein [Actinomadura rupiterrae]MCP2343645.1 uncharacterized protein YukE [Actinomadura rupiterrae]
MGQVDYPIKTGPKPSYNYGSTDFDEVKKKFKGIETGPVGDASDAYRDAGDVLAEMANNLRAHASTIVGAWKGDSAQKALDQLKQVHWTATNLSNSSATNASNYHWFKYQILDWYKAKAESMDDGMFHDSDDDKYAGEMLNKFAMRAGQAWDGHPDKITKDLPGDGKGDLGDPRNPGGGPPGGGPPGGGPPGGGPHGGGPKGSFDPNKNNPFKHFNENNNPHLNPNDHNKFNDPNSKFPNSHNPNWNNSNNHNPFQDPNHKTNLSSFDPSGMGPGGGPGGGGGGMGPFGGDGGGLGPGGSGGGLGGGGITGVPGGALGGGFGAGAAAGGRAGMNGMPMGGQHGGQGEGEKERERSTWLTEDEDVWGADDDTAPPVIG